MILGGEPSERYNCSRASCDAVATAALAWRNPKIHAESRRKIWLACADHADYLTEFLRARSFPVETMTLDEFLESPLHENGSPE
ncbi:hypothetical protein [Leucobacter sp. M11]|uniref:hypothetical protein n=1 Tax=Leucobacter sp. M11 TaxID=2993565 RepID=UPI002D7F7487|nr:hypothetical protein [Leucobacter sp. M11]MEB4613021.1 hypothetical protein [Leucobacter sp. M11]